MTAKEDAIRFYNACFNITSGTCLSDKRRKEVAIKAAKLLVNQLIELESHYRNVCNMNIESDHWYEVQAEIENL